MEPIDVLKGFMSTVEQLDTEKANEYFCQAREAQFEQGLKEGFKDLEAMGLDPDALISALQIEMEDMTYEEKSREENRAVVHVAGQMMVAFDAEQLQAALEAVAEVQGETLSDEQLALFAMMFSAIGAQQIPVEGDIELIDEGGRWVVCDELGFFGPN